MASFDLPESPQPIVSPALLVGVASPLWTYFGAAAVSGMAYWWLTQWTRPANLEALMGGKTLSSPERFVKPVLELVETAADTVVATQEAVVDALVETLETPEIAATPVGGEAAPISPLAAISSETVISGETAAAPETVAAPSQPAPSIAPEAPVEAKAVEHLLEELKPSEALLDAAATPAADEPPAIVSEFTAKPKVKKVPPAIPEA